MHMGKQPIDIVYKIGSCLRRKIQKYRYVYVLSRRVRLNVESLAWAGNEVRDGRLEL